MAVCPMCHSPAPDKAKECGECGYEFGQSLETLRGMLRGQLMNYRVMFWLMVFCCLGLGLSIYWLAQEGWLFLPMPVIAFLVWQAARAARKIAVTKQSLQMVAKQEAALPKATVVSK